MGRYDSVRERTGWGVPGKGDTKRSADEVEELIGLTHDADEKVRRIAVANLCPCHVRADFPRAWDRVLEMVTDPSPKVRGAIVHMLADGSPRDRVLDVVAALEKIRNDPERAIRRDVRRILSAYHRTGRVNVL